MNGINGPLQHRQIAFKGLTKCSVCQRSRGRKSANLEGFQIFFDFGRQLVGKKYLEINSGLHFGLLKWLSRTAQHWNAVEMGSRYILGEFTTTGATTDTDKSAQFQNCRNNEEQVYQHYKDSSGCANTLIWIILSIICFRKFKVKIYFYIFTLRILLDEFEKFLR